MNERQNGVMRAQDACMCAALYTRPYEGLGRRVTSRPPSAVQLRRLIAGSYYQLEPEYHRQASCHPWVATCLGARLLSHLLRQGRPVSCRQPVPVCRRRTAPAGWGGAGGGGRAVPIGVLSRPYIAHVPHAYQALTHTRSSRAGREDSAPRLCPPASARGGGGRLGLHAAHDTMCIRICCANPDTGLLNAIVV